MTDLTVSQQLALELIEGYWREHGRSPSVKDIAESLGCASVNNAAEHIKALERKGAIEKRYGVTRDIYPIGLKDHVKAYFGRGGQAPMEKASYASHPREYNSWRSMKARCGNSKMDNYKHYGGRGITICEEWESFESFFSDMGERPEGTSLDRIDNNGNYTPDNCRWANQKEQVHNSSQTVLSDKDVERIRMLSFENLTHKTISSIYGVSRASITNIIRGNKR